MKTLIFTGALLLCLASCKKSGNRTIQMQVTNISHTTYSINITAMDGSSPNISIIDANSNQNIPITTSSGEALKVVYNFTTEDHEFGQGNVSFIYGSKTLLQIYGGSGTQTVNVP